MGSSRSGSPTTLRVRSARTTCEGSRSARPGRWLRTPRRCSTQRGGADSVPDARVSVVTNRVASGIPIIDQRLGGGFRRPSTLLFFSEIPSEKRLFAEHFVVAGLKAGETCLYVDFYRAPQLARREFGAFGSFPADHLVFVDATSTQLLLPSDERYRIANIDDLEHIVGVIKDALRKSRPARVVLDSMEFLADRFGRKLVS